jgi:hypothetical protein
MSYLPPSEPATKADTETLRQLSEGRFDGLEARMDRLETRMDRLETRMDRLDERMGELVMSFHGELRAQTRMFILASLGSSATLAVAIVTAAAIL